MDVDVGAGSQFLNPRECVALHCVYIKVMKYNERAVSLGNA